MSKKALGKGIGALITSGSVEKDAAAGITEVDLSSLAANPHQPRHEFGESALSELAESIKQKGVLQPVLVEAAADGSYTIIAGERRVRAARMAGLRKVPVIIRQFNEQEKLEIALIENIQREDLTPIEEAHAYKRLMETAGLSQEAVAGKVGKDRSTVANSLRLLKLPPEMQEAIGSAEMSPGHARAILMVVNPADQTILYKRVVENGISVREAEQMAADLNRGKKTSGKQGKKGAPSGRKSTDPEIRDLEQELREKLGTKVAIKGTSAKGKIEIEYYSMDDLERVLEIITGRKA